MFWFFQTSPEVTFLPEPALELKLKCAGLVQGSGSQELAAQLRAHFQKVHLVRPKATRKESREIYILGRSRK